MGYEKKKKRKSSNKVTDCCMPDEEWEVSRDLEAVCRADAVKVDPERMKKVRALAAKRLDESKRKKDEAQAMIDLGNE
jgi:hypothetical protein